MLRRCWELVGDGRIFQFGIRSGDREEFRWGAGHVTTHRLIWRAWRRLLDKLAGKPVYFTVDLDVLDPSVFPGTGTPEPGGVSFDTLRQAVTLVCRAANVVGCDVNELSPALRSHRRLHRGGRQDRAGDAAGAGLIWGQSGKYSQSGDQSPDPIIIKEC